MTQRIIATTTHSHSGDGSRWDSHGLHQSPMDEALNRRGSNCSNRPAEDVVKFAICQGAEVVFFTNHSTNGEGIESVIGAQQGLYSELMKHPEWWSQAGVHYIGSADGMPPSDRNLIMSHAAHAAMTMIGYGNERVLANWQDLRELQARYPEVWIVRGTEYSLLSNGDADTDLIGHPDCQWTVMSIHPEYDKDRFWAIRRDPQRYSDLAVMGILRDYPDVFAHPGQKCTTDKGKNYSPDQEVAFRRYMDWPSIAEACLEAGTAIEMINYSRLFHFIDGLSDPATYANWKVEAVKLMPQMSLLHEPGVMAALQPYLAQGLLVAINSDAHQQINHISYYREVMDLFQYNLELRLTEHAIQPGQVINTWSGSHIKARRSGRVAPQS